MNIVRMQATLRFWLHGGSSKKAAIRGFGENESGLS